MSLQKPNKKLYHFDAKPAEKLNSLLDELHDSEKKKMISSVVEIIKKITQEV